MIFDSQTRELLGQYADGTEPISVITYSPDGSMLAIGSRDNHIYIYEVTEDSRRYGRIGRCMVGVVLQNLFSVCVNHVWF